MRRCRTTGAYREPQPRPHAPAAVRQQRAYRAVADLWASERAAGLLRAASGSYAERRAALQAALRQHGITATGRSGLTTWIPVADEGSVVAGLLAAGWAVAPGQRFRIAAPAGIRVSFASLPPRAAAAFAADLAGCLRGPGSRAD